MTILRAQAEEDIKYFQKFTMYRPVILDDENEKIWQDDSYYALKDEALNISINKIIEMYSLQLIE